LLADGRNQEHNLVFAFPDVNPAAELGIHFRRNDGSEEPVLVIDEPVDGGYMLQGQGTLEMHLRPKIAFEEHWYGSEPKQVRFPFAVLLAVAGRNALTGEPSNSLIRSPQNYFASPPQGAIDGYFVGGRVLPFRCGEMSPWERTRLTIVVFPVKKETWDHWMYQKSLCGWSHPVISGLTLEHGGERQCEPIYEDLCCIGDWDQSRATKVSVWLKDSGE
jgi:hypothetical protein